AIASGAYGARNAVLRTAVKFNSDGSAAADGEAAGDLWAPIGAANGAKLSFKGEARDWREALTKGVDALEGNGRLDLQLTEIPVASSPELSVALDPATFGGAPIKTLAAGGGVIVALNHGGVRVELVNGAPLKLASDRGDAIVIGALGGAPIFERSPAVRNFSLAAALSGPLVSGDVRLSARSEESGAWTFETSGDLGARAGANLSLAATKFSASGGVNETHADAELEIATTVRSAKLGGYRINNAPLGASLRLVSDFSAKSVDVSTTGDKCIALGRADISAEDQAVSGALDGARLCGGAGPLVSVGWKERAETQVDGVLTAKDIRYRLGETTFNGAPPGIEFKATSNADQTTVRGLINGGRVIINKAIVASNSDGSFSLRADEAGLQGDAALAALTIAQNASPVQIAPILAAGKARLAGGRLDFDFTAKSLKGEPLGAGAGRHALATGRGEVDFKTGDLKFDPNGLKITALIPALKGIIGRSDGAASAEARFIWGQRPEDFRSSGDFALRNLSFQGPTRAVTKTEGLEGELKLSSLSPLKSDGPQMLKVRLIDLDALQLQNGVAHFDLPGDDTMRIIDASFPWFGGKIGAYDSILAFTGATATTKLKAADVQLKEILDFVHVEGLSGEGKLGGELPIVFEDGKARIVNGVLKSEGPGVIRYTGQAADSAAAAGDQAKVAFSILRDLRFTSLVVTINGALDGTIEFKCDFEGTGEVPYGATSSRLPVKYGINIQANFLDLLKQANLTRDVRLQIEQAEKEQRQGTQKHD
ncbi:MAG TPA: YdbH domain-containing protein, partial [Parvularculaceae bacterium]|nr:YdbH domain-containing protein [Parvularculaceae bacterium]